MTEGATYGVVDTTFARINMGDLAEDELRRAGIPPQRIVRRTVPGFKDLGVAAKRLIEQDGCAIVVACGMVGADPIDKQCAQDAAFGIQLAQALTSTHVLEVFVHVDEVDTDEGLWKVTDNRVREHALNAVWLVERPDELRRRAGTGQRQGFADEGAIAPPGPTGRQGRGKRASAPAAKPPPAHAAKPRPAPRAVQRSARPASKGKRRRKAPA